MDSRTESQLAQLKLYLQNLAQVNTQIPRLETSDSLYRFHWEKDVGLEGAINRELEIRLGSQAKGPIKFKEWGPGLEAVVQVLRQYLNVIPESILLVRKWLSDLTEAALLVFKEANLPIPEPNTSQGVDSESSVPSPDSEPTNTVPKQQGAGIKIDATSSSKKAGRSKKRSKPPCDKPATKTLTTFEDLDYDESGESDDNQTARTLPLLYKVSKPCQPRQPTKSQIDSKTEINYVVLC
ncbi:hypothetical protein JVT61DRAFT_11820 [Boletus reticuloceps]|uniref:Uncharacterized protein n=1 Tax=Boletus reticuloceps TaxID=495285 RepID=A0A8I2YZE2_9AGAM|nr:hypothetical protein JVT61DRAFT_11820 [Boletus reticuloceps]